MIACELLLTIITCIYLDIFLIILTCLVIDQTLLIILYKHLFKIEDVITMYLKSK